MFTCFERPLSGFFYRYAYVVGRFPLPFLLVPLIITAFMATAFRNEFRMLPDDIALYTPSDGRAKYERRVFQQYFSINETSPFFLERQFDPKRQGFVIVTTPLDSFDRNILRPEIFEEIAKLWSKIEAMVATRLTDSGRKETFTYNSLCVRIQLGYTKSMCVQNTILISYLENPHFLRRVRFPKTLEGAFIGNLLGNVTINKDTGFVEAAGAILLPFQLRSLSLADEAKASAWECKLSEILGHFQSSIIHVDWLTSLSLADESNRDTNQLKRLILPLFIVITTFTVLCCFVRSRIRSKPWLGIGGILSAVCAIVSTVGALMWIGAEFCSVAYFMPFVVLSIGVDNVFILLAAWRNTDSSMSVAERMGCSFKEAGVSITVTTLTDICSFVVGCTNSFPSVRIFCLAAAVAIGFIYLYQLTIFAACLTWTGSAEKNGRHCVTFQKIIDYQPGCISVDEMNYCSSQLSSTGKGSAVSFTLSKARTSPSGHCVSGSLTDSYARCLLSPSVKTLILLCFAGYIGVAVWGVSRMKIGVNPVDLLPRDSYARRSLIVHESEFSTYGDYLHLCFTNLATDLNYNHPRYWHRLAKELEAFENTTFTELSDSWLREFLAYSSNILQIQLNQHNFLRVLRHFFLKQDIFRKYESDIIFDDSSVSTFKLSAVRFPIRLQNFGLSNHSTAIPLFRSLAATSKLNTTVYHKSFELADQFDSLLPNTLLNILQAGGAVIAISLLLIPKPLCALWVSVTIVSINLGVLGLMSLWSVNLDFVSMTTIIMSIGFCVDFSAHIAYHYSKERSVNPVEKGRSTLDTVGMPILQSAISTILGVAVLVYVDNYVFRSFVKTVVLVVILGVLHGLVILPVLLTLVSCGSKSGAISSVSPKPATIFSVDDVFADRQYRESSRRRDMQLRTAPPVEELVRQWKLNLTNGNSHDTIDVPRLMAKQRLVDKCPTRDAIRQLPLPDLVTVGPQDNTRRSLLSLTDLWMSDPKGCATVRSIGQSLNVRSLDRRPPLGSHQSPSRTSEDQRFRKISNRLCKQYSLGF